MKKIFALILAIVMIASMSVVVFAIDNSDAVDVDKAAADAANGNLGGTVLTYGVSETYTITIPADQNFGANAGGTDDKAFKATANIIASDVKIKGNQTLTVAVESVNEWQLKEVTNASSPVDYALYISENTTAAEAELGEDAVVLSVKVLATDPVDGANKTNTMNFYTAGTAQVGKYQDQLTFKVAIA